MQAMASPVDLLPRQVRDQMLFVRVTDDERRAIAGAAAESGMTMVGFMRAAARMMILSLQAPAVVSPAPRAKPAVKKKRHAR